MLRLLFLVSLLLASSPAWAVCNQLSSTYMPQGSVIADNPRNTVEMTEYCTKRVRITDSTDGESASIADALFTGMSSDNTRMLIFVGGGAKYGWEIYSFTPSTMQSAWLADIGTYTSACHAQYAAWDQTGNNPKTLYCMPNDLTDANRKVTAIDTSTGTLAVSDLIDNATLKAKLNITGTVNTVNSTTSITVNFTDFDAQDDNYKGMNITVGANAAQAITGYTASTKTFTVGSALSSLSPGQTVTISPTGYNVNGLFSVSANGSTLCFGVSDGASTRNGGRGRYLLAYRFADASLKIHRLSYAEIIGSSGLSYTPHTNGGIHAGSINADGTKCSFSVESQSAITGTFWYWAIDETNPIPATGDGKIYGPGVPATVGHVAYGNKYGYSYDGDTGATYKVVPYSSITSTPSTIYTMPTKSGLTWYVGQDQYSNALTRVEGLVMSVNEFGTNAPCGSWELVSGAIYRTTAAWGTGFSFPCSNLLDLTAANNARLFHNGSLLTKVGSDTATAASCPGLMSAGTWCWASDVTKPYVWALSSQDLTVTATESFSFSASSNTTVTLAAGASAVNSYYNGRLINIPHSSGGTAPPYGALRKVTAYNGTTKVATFGALSNSGTAGASGTAYIYGNVIWAYDARAFIQCIHTFQHNLSAGTATTRIIDCPTGTTQTNDNGNFNFYSELNATISTDGCWVMARLPWTQERFDVFVYSLCGTTPAMANIKAVSNAVAASNFKAVTVTGDQGY